MTTAKKELEEFIKECKCELKCAIILFDKSYISLKEDFSEKDLDKFKSELNFKYDGGYGTQNLYGTLWFTDGSHANRGEYDGSEWWERHVTPEIPKELKSIKNTLNKL